MILSTAAKFPLALPLHPLHNRKDTPPYLTLWAEMELLIDIYIDQGCMYYTLCVTRTLALAKFTRRMYEKHNVRGIFMRNAPGEKRLHIYSP